jgi:hypothetical protein
VEQAKTPPAAGSPATRVQEKDLAGFVGWQDEVPLGGAGWIQRIIGWMLTAVAVSLGAPFWFDLLNRFMNLRNSVKAPDEAAQKKAA